MDIVKECVDVVECELECVVVFFLVVSDGSGWSVRVISICSDVSVRSDEVFDGVFFGVFFGLLFVLFGSLEFLLKR